MKKVIGECTTTIVPLADGFSEFEVDAVAFKNLYVKDASGSNLSYDYDGKKIKIKLPSAYSAGDTIRYTINYDCQPQRGLYFVYPTELNPSNPYQVWTQGQGEDNKHWIPIYDYPNDKATSEIYINVDEKFTTVSNGYLDYTKAESGIMGKTDHWVQDKPHPSYLIMLAVGEFRAVNDEGDGIPIISYGWKDREEESKYSFRNTPAMMKVYNERFGYKYPWANYKQVIVKDFIYGGMENTAATVLNERTYYTPEVETDYSSDNLISHELTHQWWGDLTTCRNWSEIWLNESFATYGTALWKEIYYGDAGKDEYDYYILRAQDDAIKADSTKKRLPIWAGYGEITENSYDKGASMLHTFRHILGDEKFFASLQTFLKDNEFKNVVTQDLIDAVNKTMNDGKDYRWMFDQWIYKAGYPEFRVTHEYNDTTKQLKLTVRQVQKLDSLTPLFRAPVDVRIKTVLEDKIERIEVTSEESQTFTFNVDSEPKIVHFDYGNKILDKSYLPFSSDFTGTPNAIDRITSLRNELISVIDLTDGRSNYFNLQQSGMAAVHYSDDTMNEYKSLLLGDKFWGVRVEAAKFLGSLRDAGLLKINFEGKLTPRKILLDAYSRQTDSRVKREILKALGNFKNKKISEFIKEKIENEKNLYIVADGITALSNSLPPEDVYDAVIPYINVKSHRHVVLNAVVEALDSADNYIDDERIKEALKDVAFGIDVESRLRTKAIKGLKKYAKDDEIKSLAKKHLYYNFRPTKIALMELLAESGDKSMIEPLSIIGLNTSDEALVKAYDAAAKKLGYKER
jgi:aminopeptidase N